MLLFSCVVGVADSVPSQWTECVFSIEELCILQEFSFWPSKQAHLYIPFSRTFLSEKRENVFNVLNNDR